MKRQWNAEEMKEAARDAYCSAHGDCVFARIEQFRLHETKEVLHHGIV